MSRRRKTRAAPALTVADITTAYRKFRKGIEPFVRSKSRPPPPELKKLLEYADDSVPAQLILLLLWDLAREVNKSEGRS